MKRYREFLKTKLQNKDYSGFDPVFMPDSGFDFQQYLADWNIRKGRSATLADCGLGKTWVQLVFAENVVRKTNKPVLVFTPLAVAQQTVREAEKFGIEAFHCPDGKLRKGINVANYERIHYFDPNKLRAWCATSRARSRHLTGSGGRR